MAREAIDLWLARRDRESLHQALGAYARAAAGTADDLDPHLEAASVEHLLDQERRKRDAVAP